MIVGYETNLKKFMRKEQQGALSSTVVIYNKKGKLDSNQTQIYMKFRITNCCTQLESSGCFCVS